MCNAQWHRLVGIDERYIIVSGRGRVEVGDIMPTMVGPGVAGMSSDH